MTFHVDPDAELLVRGLLRAHITAEKGAGNVGCTTGVPSGWTTASKPHLTVQSDGAAGHAYPVVSWPTVRVQARAASADAAKALAAWAESRLLAHNGTAGVTKIRPLLRVQPAVDPETNIPFAWFTVRASVRTVAD